MIRKLLVLPLLWAASTPAHAACEWITNSISSLGSAQAPASYQQLIQCDQKIASKQFENFMVRAVDVNEQGIPADLIKLAKLAIEGEIWAPVWEMIGNIPDYELRDVVAAEIASSCSEADSKLIPFLKAGYIAMRGIEFEQWDDTLLGCQSESFSSWMVQTLTQAPESDTDGKWETLAGVYAEREGSSALSLLSGAAAGTSNSRTFEAILSTMQDAVSPAFGEIPADKADQLEASLKDLATKVDGESVRSIADRLMNIGREAAAASLLPSIYPERVQGGGGFMYGGVAIEQGDCKGTPSAVLHVSQILEGGSRYSLIGLADDQLRAMKPRLGKCDVDTPWTVQVSNEPLKGSKELDAFVAMIQSQLEEKGVEVKIRSEADIQL